MVEEHSFEICVCGHGEYEHNFHIGGGLFEVETIRDDCKNSKCMCPEYEKLKVMTYSEWMKYQEDNQIPKY